MAVVVACWYGSLPNASAIENVSERLDDLLRARPRSGPGSRSEDGAEETSEFAEEAEPVALR